MAKILLAAERKGGKISIRDAQLAFTSKFRPNAQMARSWFGELVALDYGKVQKSGNGKSLIFEITPRLQDHCLQQPSSSVPVNVSSSTTTSIISLQNLQQPPSSVDFVDEMIHHRLQAEPIQEQDFRDVVDDDPVDNHLSEKIENENVTDCVEFIRTARENADPETERVPFQKI